MVVLPEPTTPITMTIMGEDCNRSAAVSAAVAEGVSPSHFAGETPPRRPARCRRYSSTPALFLGVSFLSAGAGVGDGKRPVCFRGDFDVLAFAVFFDVRNALFGNVVVLIRFGGVVQLPQVLQPWRIVDDLPRCRT